MRRALVEFLSPTNGVFAGLLIALAMTIIVGIAVHNGPGLMYETSESWNDVVVLPVHAEQRGFDQYGRDREQHAATSSGYVPLSEVSPDTVLVEAGRDTGSRATSVELRGVPPWLLTVVPMFLLLLSLWPLLAAFQARRWLLGVAYVCVMVVVCWHSYETSWREFPGNLVTATRWSFDPAMYYVAFLLLALMPARAATPRPNAALPAAALVYFCMFSVVLTFGLNEAAILRQTSVSANYVSFRLRSPDHKMRTFTSTEIAASTIPTAYDEQSDVWEYAGGGGTGTSRGYSKGSDDLGGVAFLVVLGHFFTILLVLWPCRILARKGLPARGIFISALALLVSGVCVWQQLTLLNLAIGPVRLDAGLMGTPLLIAMLHRGKPQGPTSGGSQLRRDLRASY